MSDAWEEIQAVKSKRNSLREKLEKRKKERQNILGATLAPGTSDRQDGSPVAGRAEKSVSSPGLPKEGIAVIILTLIAVLIKLNMDPAAFKNNLIS